MHDRTMPLTCKEEEKALVGLVIYVHKIEAVGGGGHAGRPTSEWSADNIMALTAYNRVAVPGFMYGTAGKKEPEG